MDNSKAIDCNMQKDIRLIENNLTDNSKTYDIKLGDNFDGVSIPCIDYDKAIKLYNCLIECMI